MRSSQHLESSTGRARWMLRLESFCNPQLIPNRLEVPGLMAHKFQHEKRFGYRNVAASKMATLAYMIRPPCMDTHMVMSRDRRVSIDPRRCNDA